MITSLTEFGGWVFADDGFTAELNEDDSRGQYTINPVINERAGASPALGQGNVSPRVMAYLFHYDASLDPLGPRDIRTMYDVLVGKLDPTDTSPRRLIGTRWVDGARVQQYAVINAPAQFDPQYSINHIEVTWTGVARWDATANDAVTAVVSDVGQYAAFSVPNAGYATVEPTITIQPTVTAHLTTSAAVGWKFRRQWTVTNNGVNAWDRPLRLDMGDTTVWVSDGAKSNGNDVRILLNGEELPRTLIAWNYPQSYGWINPAPIAPGETVTFDATYGNASAGTADRLDGKLHPSFIYEYATGAATSGSSTTLLNDTGQAWNIADVNWKGAYLTMVSGTAGNLGVTREITAYTTNSVTVSPAFPSTIAATDKYLIAHSSNARWWQNVGKWFDLYAGTPVRGLWYLDKRDRPPSDVDFDTPASWRPYAMFDNQDRFAQKSVSLKSGKYYAFLDAYRSWQGGGPKGQLTSEDGIADGVLLHSSIPILGVQIDHTLSNNLNGMCQALVMAKASGAEDFETIHAYNTAGTNTETTYLTLPTPDQYFDLYRGLGPSDTEGIIRPDRARDQGSTTADGATRNITTNSSGGPFAFRVDASSSAAHVQDATPANVDIPNSTVVELSGGNKGSWREVIYNDGTNEYTGWIALTSLNTGSATGGDTIVDGSKSWVVNGMVGAQVKITGSNNASLVGKVHVVASNTATTLTVTNAFGATVIQGTAYETIQPKTTVTLQDNSIGWVDFDVSSLSISAVTAKQDVYQIAAELSVGDGGPALFERKVSTRIGLDGRRVFARTTDSLILDGPNRKASLVDSTGALIRTLTDPAVLVQQITQDPVNRRTVTKRAARWLPLGMGTNAISDGNAETGVVGFYSGLLTGAGWTLSSPAIDTTTPLAGTKSYYTTVSASGLITTFSLIAALGTTPFLVAPGQRVQFTTGLYTTNADLRPTLGVAWLNNLGNPISYSYAPAWTPVVSTWYRCGYSGINPDLSNASINWTDADVVSASGSGAIVYGVPIIKITAAVGGATGVIRWDEFDEGSPVLWYAETGGNAVSVTVSFPKGYLG